MPLKVLENSSRAIRNWLRGSRTQINQRWGVSPRLSAHAAMCAFGIDKLRQHAAEILLLGGHAEHNTFGAHVSVESLDIGDSEAQFHFSCWVLVRSRV